MEARCRQSAAPWHQVISCAYGSVSVLTLKGAVSDTGKYARIITDFYLAGNGFYAGTVQSRESRGPIFYAWIFRQMVDHLPPVVVDHFVTIHPIAVAAQSRIDLVDTELITGGGTRPSS